MGTGPLSGVRGVVGDRVAGDTPPIPTQDGRVTQWEATPHLTDPRLYRVSFPRAARSVGFPVEGYNGRETMNKNLCVHFVHCHVWYTIVIMEKYKLPHPRLTSCNMVVLWADINHHQPMCIGCRPLNAAYEGGGGTVGCSNGIPGICLTTGYSDVIQIPGVNPHRNGQ